MQYNSGVWGQPRGPGKLWTGPENMQSERKEAHCYGRICLQFIPRRSRFSIHDANQFPTDEKQSIDDISLTVSFHNKSLGLVDITKAYNFRPN